MEQSGLRESLARSSEQPVDLAGAVRRDRPELPQEPASELLLASFEPPSASGANSAKTENSPRKLAHPEAVELQAYSGPTFTFAGLANFHQGLPASMRVGKAVDGGTVRYDAAGNVIGWTSADLSTDRQFTYKDVGRQIAALAVNPALPFNFDPADSKLHQLRPDRLTPAERAQGVKPDNVSIDLKLYVDSLKKPQALIDQRLQSVQEGSGAVWLRQNSSELMQKFQTDSSGHLMPTDKFARDDQLIPRTIPDARENRLYADQASPQASVNASGIEQGNLGDCVFEAALADQAEHDPDAILKMIKDNKDGTYTVNFGSAVNVRVEAPTEAELEAFNGPSGIDFVGQLMKDQPQTVIHKQPGPNIGYWATVIEKAHRYLSGNVSEDRGEDPGTGFGLLTGLYRTQNYLNASSFQNFTRNRGLDPKNVDWLGPRLNQQSNSDMGNAIKTALDKGELIIAATADHNNQWVRLADGTSSARGHLLPVHAYSVMDYEPASSGKEAQIVLRNPWADLAALGVHRGAGYFRVSLSDFHKLFAQIIVND